MILLELDGKEEMQVTTVKSEEHCHGLQYLHGCCCLIQKT